MKSKNNKPDQGSSELNSASSAENFLLHHFIKSSGKTVQERTKPFSDYFHRTTGQGYALYAREIIGPTGPTVLVKDSMTGQTRKMVMMGSNNYLGFANHPQIKEAVKKAIDTYGVGMGGPPLLNGMSSLHRQLEIEIARLKGKQDALIYPSGFQANLGWINAILRSGDVLVCDEYHHASLFDGMRLARSVHKIQPRIFRHNDMAHLEKILKYHAKKLEPDANIFVAVEGVYSMDGDSAPLREIAQLCRQYKATLCLDDAHGTGVLGVCGAGTANHFGVSDDVTVAMGTFSKTFGVTGGFVAGSRELIDYLRYFSRSYMFSAHLPQTVVAAILAGLELLKTDLTLIPRLQHNIKYMLEGLRSIGFKVKTDSAIIPIYLPATIDARKLGKRLHEEGLFCNMIEPPAVRADEQRIRLSVIASHSQEDLDFALTILKKLGKEFSLVSSKKKRSNKLGQERPKADTSNTFLE